MRWDVVVFRTEDTYRRAEVLGPGRPVIARVDLGHEMFIERLDAAVAAEISSRCSAGAVGSAIAQRYSFVRQFPDGVDPQDFDEDDRLQIAIGLSRLVNPTSVGLEESAQVWGPIDDATRIRLRPGPITGPASEAYRADTTRPDWLTPTEAAELRALLDAYFARPLPERLARGLWHHEFAARALDMASRWTSVVTGLEALFNTDREFVTRQFRMRCAAVAAELTIPLTPRQADEAYQLRSRLSHGSMTRVEPATLALYVLVERLLRDTLRTAITDPAWCARFSDEPAIRRAWPVETPDVCPQCHQPRPAAQN